MDAAKVDEILLSLWKWKMLTMAGIHRLHFPNNSPITAYREIGKLRKRGLVRMNSDEYGQRFVLCLTRKGFKHVLNQVGSLREEGFESEHFEHDLITTAVHLGDWSDGAPEGCDLFSEQELRRRYHDQYPEWVPQNPIHRSDGYWRMKVPNTMPGTMALEVELNLKRETDYRICGWFYEDNPVYRVVWVVRTLHAANKIWGYITEKRRQPFIPHNIMLLKDFLDHGWSARFILGPEKNQTLHSLLNGLDENRRETFCSSYLLDTRKSGTIAGPCKGLNFSRVIK